MKSFKGTIALDIDGTLTVHHDFIEHATKKYLEKVSKEGWKLFFLTGRTFSFAVPLFKDFEAPYLLAVQNGASLYEMPDKKLVAHHRISHVSIAFLEKILKENGTGLLVESGLENQDICYYVPSDFSKEDKAYLKYRMSITPTDWQALSSFDALTIKDFAVGKYFAREAVARKVAECIQNSDQLLQVTVIRDPFRPGFSLALINHSKASKGNILEQSKASLRPLIAGGDDYNDIEMLKKADVKIVMENAPSEVLQLGDIIALPASEKGIIIALEKAIKRVLGQNE